MENASKALIIAGGVLITLLVISISMYFYTSFRDAYGKNMQIKLQYEIDSFNSFFTKYDSKVSGIDAYNILSKISDVNAQPNSLVRKVEASGTVNLSNYENYFYFTEHLKEEFYFSYSLNSSGIVDSITLNHV